MGETNFQPRDFPEVGQKQKSEKKEREKTDANATLNAKPPGPKVVNNNGQLRTANATSGGASKAAWANYLFH